MDNVKGRELSELLYRSVFQHSAVSLWIQDITELRGMIREWQRRGIKDLRGYLNQRPAQLQKAVHSIRILDVNDATIEMYEVKNKRELLVPLDQTLDLNDPVVAKNMIGDVVAIAEKREHIEKESTAVSPSGKRMEIRIQEYIPPEGSAVPHMLVSVLDITEAKRLEREIERDRALYHAVIDNLPDSVYLKDVQRRFVVANQAAAELLAVDSPALLIGRADEDFVPAEKARLFATEEETLLRTGKEIANETDLTTSDGVRHSTLYTKVPVRNTSGKISGIVGITKDITALRAVERALRESEHRYREVYDGAPFGIFHATQAGRLTDCNPAFAAVLGFRSPKELLSFVALRGMGTLTADPKSWKALVERASRRKDWHHVKWEFRRRDGTVGTSRMVARSEETDTGQGPLIEGFTEDVTEQEVMQQSLQYERSLYSALMDNILDRIFFKDREGRYTLVNRAQARAVGESSPQALIGKRASDYFAPEYAERARVVEQQVLDTGEPLIDLEEHVVRPGAEDIWYLTTRMVVRDPDGIIIGIFGVSRDITARKKVQARLIRSERLQSLGQLAAGIAHQFNNINSAALARIEAAFRVPDLPDSVRGHLENILAGIRRSTEITGRLEPLSLGTEPEATPILLADLLAKIARPLRTSLSHDGVTLRTHLRATPPVRASESVVRFVAASLISNSVDALIDRAYPQINLSTVVAGKAAGFVIEDNGSGISEKDLPKLFTPFYTTKGEWAQKDSRQSAAAGIGLSLAVTRSLVIALGGNVEVQSEEGNGTIITVMLPLA